jgi:hypothetical protein
MERLLRLTKAAIIGGALLVLPVVLTLLMIAQAWILARRVLDPLAAALGLEGWSVLGADLLAALLLLLVCFAIRPLVQTRLGGRARTVLEAGLLNRLPAYGEIKAFAHSVAGMEHGRYRSVLVDVHGVDAWAPALLIEPERDGRAVPLAQVQEVDAGWPGSRVWCASSGQRPGARGRGGRRPAERRPRIPAGAEPQLRLGRHRMDF